MITKILSLESVCAPLAGVISHTALPPQSGEREGEGAARHLANGPLFSPAARLTRARFQSVELLKRGQESGTLPERPPVPQLQAQGREAHGACCLETEERPRPGPRAFARGLGAWDAALSAPTLGRTFSLGGEEGQGHPEKQQWPEPRRSHPPLKSALPTVAHRGRGPP